eukprot:gene25675-49085_t
MGVVSSAAHTKAATDGAAGATGPGVVVKEAEWERDAIPAS